MKIGELQEQDPELGKLEEGDKTYRSSKLKMGNQLDRKKREELHKLLRIIPEITSNKPGKAELTHHGIPIVKEEKPIRQQPYRIPRAYQGQVEKELQKIRARNYRTIPE